jgi:TRAP-type C4-dicarboxylate transport system substrate-binding protein
MVAGHHVRKIGDEEKKQGGCDMKKGHLLTRVLLGLLFVCLMISPAVSQDTSKKVYNFKLYSSSSATSIFGRVESRFIDSVKQATNGRVVITPYWSSSLLPRQQAWKGLVDGVYEFAHLIPDDFPGTFPVLDIVHLPFFFKDATDTRKALRALYHKGMMPELSKVKLGALRATSGAYMAFTKKEVKKLEDLKGLKIRSASGTVGEVIKELGAVPVGGIIYSDLYMSLDRGVIDGIINPNSFMPTYKLYEVIKYVLDVPLWTGGLIQVMNLNAWNSLPDDLKAIMDKEFVKMEDDWVNTENTEGQKGRETMMKNGVKYVAPSPAELARLRQATQGVIANYVKKLSDRGLPGQKIVDEARAAAGSK